MWGQWKEEYQLLQERVRAGMGHKPLIPMTRSSSLTLHCPLPSLLLFYFSTSSDTKCLGP